MGCYLAGDVIHPCAIKSFSCLLPYIKPLLKRQDIFLQVVSSPNCGLDPAFYGLLLSTGKSHDPENKLSWCPKGLLGGCRKELQPSALCAD